MEFTHWPAGLTFLAHIYAMIPEVFRVVFLSFLFFCDSIQNTTTIQNLMLIEACDCSLLHQK